MTIIDYIDKLITRRYNIETDDYSRSIMCILKEKLRMISMGRYDKIVNNNSFIPAYINVNDFYSFINELSDEEYEIFVTHVANFRKSNKKIDRYETDSVIFKFMYKISCIKYILESCHNELKHIMYIIDNFNDSLKWNLNQINFPIKNILNFTEQKYIITSLQNQFSFIEKLSNAYKNNRFKIDFQYYDYDNTIATHIQNHCHYSIYFVLLFQCSNICKLSKTENFIIRYYFSSTKNMKFRLENMLKSVHNLSNWEMILEDDDMELYQNYYLPHPDHFVYVEKSISKEKLLFKLSFPYGFFVANK